MDMQTSITASAPAHPTFTKRNKRMKMATGLGRLALAGWLVTMWGSGAAAHTPPRVSGRPPEPTACTRIICNAGDAAWEEVPLPVGTRCNGTGHCDAHAFCVLAPPTQQTLHVHLDDMLLQSYQTLLAGSFISIDTTGQAPRLITGSHTLCVHPPGEEPYCFEAPTSTNAYLQFFGSAESALRQRDAPGAEGRGGGGGTSSLRRPLHLALR